MSNDTPFWARNETAPSTEQKDLDVEEDHARHVERGEDG